jgi:hypothetical protein
VAWENVGVKNFSIDAHVTLWGFAVVWLLNKSSAILKSKTATIIRPVQKAGTEAWIEREGVELKSGQVTLVTLFKRVSKDFLTQEGDKNETKWEIGKRIVHPSPSLKDKECGEGKFHFVSRPYFADQFRDKKSDRYIALSVPVKTLYAWPNAEYPHKISGTEATVLYECNRFGKKI